MPLNQRTIKSNNTSPSILPVFNDFDLDNSYSFSEVISQLSVLSAQAKDIFSEIFSILLTYNSRMSSLQERIDDLTVSLNTFQSESFCKNEGINVVLCNEANPISVHIDQQIFNLESAPVPFQNLVNSCNGAPPLHLLDAFRDDNKSSLKFYTNPSYFFDLWKEDMMKSQKVGKTKRKNVLSEREKNVLLSKTTLSPNGERDALVHNSISTSDISLPHIREFPTLLTSHPDDHLLYRIERDHKGKATLTPNLKYSRPKSLEITTQQNPKQYSTTQPCLYSTLKATSNNQKNMYDVKSDDSFAHLSLNYNTASSLSINNTTNVNINHNNNIYILNSTKQEATQEPSLYLSKFSNPCLYTSKNYDNSNSFPTNQKNHLFNQFPFYTQSCENRYSENITTPALSEKTYTDHERDSRDQSCFSQLPPIPPPLPASLLVANLFPVMSFDCDVMLQGSNRNKEESSGVVASEHFDLFKSKMTSPNLESLPHPPPSLTLDAFDNKYREMIFSENITTISDNFSTNITTTTNHKENDIFASIKSGIQLKKIESVDVKVSKNEPGTDVASILARRIAMESSDDEDTNEDNSEWDEANI